MDSSLLADAAVGERLDPGAEEYCNTHVKGLPLVAAVNSTSGEVRDIASMVETRGRWDTDLPTDLDTLVTICIFDVAGVPALEDGIAFMAYWATSTGQQALTAW
jgi:hypothetical protein